MFRAEQALEQFLTIGLSEEPEEILRQKAQALIEQFKADSGAHHRAMNLVEDAGLLVAHDLEKLRVVVDRELDRRLDQDLADQVCDLLEHLSGCLHAETDRSAQSEGLPNAAARGAAEAIDAERRHRLIAEAAYRLAEQRQFEPGHELEDWLAAERAFESHGRPAKRRPA